MVTSRERLLSAMQLQALDRVPISTYELVGWNKNAWENNEPSYSELMQVIRDNTDCIYMTGVRWRQLTNNQSIVETRKWNESNSTYTDVTWHTAKGDLHALYRVDANVHTRWTLEHMLKDIEDIDKYLSIPWQPAEVDMADFYHRQTELGSHGVMMLSVSDPICLVAGLFEMGTFLVHALTEPQRISYMLDAVHERQMAELSQILAHDVRGVMFRIVGPEYATPPYLGPDHFRQYVTRYLAPICEAITRAGGFARVHCHGKIGQVLDQIVAAGAQGIDPVEPPPDGDIELGAIKKRYGKRLCLFGNFELKELETATPERIDLLVRLAMDQAKEGGGFVLMPTAAPINVPLSSKTENNYYRYIEAGLKYGMY